MNQIALITEETFDRISQVSSNLFHPLTVRLVDYSCDMNAPSLDVDGKQHEITHKSTQSQHFYCEEVHCSYRSPMRFQERLPVCSLAAFGCWFETRIGQDALDRVSAKIVTKIPECSAYSRIAPTWIFFGHLNNKLGNVSLGWRSTRATRCGAVVLLSDEIAIPMQQSVRCHDAGDPEQG